MRQEQEQHHEAANFRRSFRLSKQKVQTEGASFFFFGFVFWFIPSSAYARGIQMDTPDIAAASSLRSKCAHPGAGHPSPASRRHVETSVPSALPCAASMSWIYAPRGRPNTLWPTATETRGDRQMRLHAKKSKFVRLANMVGAHVRRIRRTPRLRRKHVKNSASSKVFKCALIHRG